MFLFEILSIFCVSVTFFFIVWMWLGQMVLKVMNMGFDAICSSFGKCDAFEVVSYWVPIFGLLQDSGIDNCRCSFWIAECEILRMLADALFMLCA